jgi:bifunctional non-homologous end joining protein LigD
MGLAAVPTGAAALVWKWVWRSPMRASGGRVGLRCSVVRESQPTFVPPMLLTAGSVPDGVAWSLELKWDGCRAQLRYGGRAPTLRTRNGRECSSDFPELLGIADALVERQVTLDGELVCLRDDGRPDFARLRRRLAGPGASPAPVLLQVFDILHLDGHSTRGLPYRERRALLDELALDGPAWRTPASIVLERSEAFVARVAELGLEGVVAKRLDSRYMPGRRSAAWIKHKLRRDERLVVTGVRRRPGGWTEALFVARPLAGGSLARAGSIELGLRPDLMQELDRRLAELPARRRGAVAWYPAEVSVVASVHGLPDGAVRDALLREIVPVSDGTHAQQETRPLPAEVASR